MKTVKLVLFALFIVVGFYSALFLTMFYVMSSNMCGNYMHAELHSPDNEHKAVVFQRDCGATTDFSTQVSILRANEALEDSSGNVMIVRGHPDTHALELEWLSNTELRIDRPLDGTERKAKPRFEGNQPISIRYAEGDPSQLDGLVARQHKP